MKKKRFATITDHSLVQQRDFLKIVIISVAVCYGIFIALWIFYFKTSPGIFFMIGIPSLVPVIVLLRLFEKEIKSRKL